MGPKAPCKGAQNNVMEEVFSETRRHEGVLTLFTMCLATLLQRPPSRLW